MKTGEFLLRHATWTHPGQRARGPGWWPLSQALRAFAVPRLRPIVGWWLLSLALSLATSVANVQLGWNGVPVTLGGIQFDLTIYPPLVFSVLASLWLGPGWGLVPIYAANLASALASGMSLPISLLFALAGMIETGMLWGALVMLQVDPDLRRPRDAFLFGACSLVAVSSTSLAVTIWAAAHDLSAHEAQHLWWGWLWGDLLLILLVVTPALMLVGPRLRRAIDRRFDTSPRHEVSYRRSVAVATAAMATLVALVFLGAWQLLSNLERAAPLPGPANNLRITEVLWFLALLCLSLLTAAGLFSYAIARLGEQQRLEASRDSLTGLWNRRSFEPLFEIEAERSRRLGKGLALLFMDLDHFKQINDELGHELGDRALIRVGHRVEQTLRQTDLLFRWGGEELVALLPHTNLTEAVLVAERVRSAVAAEPFRLAQGTPKRAITISLGASAADEFPYAADDLLAEADRACYEAKRQGRNRTVQAAPPPREL
jgi:diguanylate cyclase